jgi:acylphosphatase
MSRAAVRLLVEGRVQGVGFRWWVTAQAAGLGLDGWVRNLTDGRVEVLAIGHADAIERLADVCERGPAGAQVRLVARLPAEDDGSMGFEQKATV